MVVRDMSQPSSLKEYEELFAKNMHVEGTYLDVSTYMPCPFCAHPDFYVMLPFQGVVPGDDRPDIDEQMSQVATCENCGRSGKNIVDRNETGVSFEFVQTGGDPPPEWLIPAPRRIE